MSSNDTQKVILITGTSSGFGLLFAARLAARGHYVYATMRDLSRKQPLLDEVGKRGGHVEVVALDVTKTETIKPVIDAIVRQHAHIDVLINNAGYGLGGFFEDLTADEIRGQMETNFFGVQEMCRAVLPSMRENMKGKIINISSIAGLTATPCLGAYNASKWALEGFSESLFYEVQHFGIHVVLVEPGAYPTQIFKSNARYGKNYSNPQSPYFHFSQAVRHFVEQHVHTSKRNPEVVAALIDRIIDNPRPNVRYYSDFSSWLRVMISRMIPPSLYAFIFRKVIYGKNIRPV